jgi:hypothetical protein
MGGPKRLGFSLSSRLHNVQGADSETTGSLPDACYLPQRLFRTRVFAMGIHRHLFLTPSVLGTELARVTG